MRVGLGHDSHRLAKGRRLVVGGVEVPCDRGPVAHSDGDVLLHAVIDAMLGAAGLGDIGEHFPDSDQRYEGADSRTLLRRTKALLARKGLRAVQVDSTVLLERPKLGALKRAMAENIAADLGLRADAVNVKAKTAEGLDAVGRGRAIEAEAVVVVKKRRSTQTYTDKDGRTRTDRKG